MNSRSNMDSRSNLRLFDTRKCSQGQEGEALIEDYLDHLCAPLVGIVSFIERRSLRAEVEAHIDALTTDYVTI